MKNLYLVTVRLFDTFEEISDVKVEAVIASDEEDARNQVSKVLEAQIEEVEAPCASYEILKIEFFRGI